jgi:hypothetical protein
MQACTIGRPTVARQFSRASSIVSAKAACGADNDAKARKPTAAMTRDFNRELAADSRAIDLLMMPLLHSPIGARRRR